MELVGPAREAFDQGRGYDGISQTADGSALVAHYDLVRDLTGKPVAVIAAAFPPSDVDAQVARAVWPCVVATVVTSALTLIVLALFVRPIGGRLTRVAAAIDSIVRDDVADVTAAVRALADGNLTVRLTARSQADLAAAGKDEAAQLSVSYNALAAGLASLRETFNTTLAHLQAAVRAVSASAANVSAKSAEVYAVTNASTDKLDNFANICGAAQKGAQEQAQEVTDVGSAVEELARTSAQIAAGATDQATSLEAVSEAVRRLDSDILSTADVAEKLSASGQGALTQTQSGRGAVAQTRQAMQRVGAEAESAVSTMQKLTERSNAVEEIISTIEEISDQTNLLALNAAIEAARAGEHGRGFKVVADEVRKLAARAAASTREISAILSSIREQTVAAQTAMTSSAEATDEGLALAASASRVLDSLEAAAAEQQRAVAVMAEHAEQMRQSSASVTQSVSAVAAVVHENASAATQMNATTGHLTAAVNHLAETAQFRVKNAGNAFTAAREIGTEVARVGDDASSLSDEGRVLSETVAAFRLDDSIPPVSSPTRDAAAPRRPHAFAG